MYSESFKNIKKSIIQSIQSIEQSRSRAIKPSRIQEDKDSKSQGIKKSGLTLSQVRQDVTVINYLIVFIQNGSNDLSNFWYEVRQ